MNFRTVALLLLFASFSFSQSIVTIDSLRYNDSNGVPIGLGNVYTTSGIVTNSNQFGNAGPGAIQDNIAGVSVYGIDFSNQVDIGDSVTVTGELAQFNGLTEINFTLGGASLVVHSTGNHFDTVIVTLNQIKNQQWNGYEEYEGLLVRVNNVTIQGTGNFTGGTNYNISDPTDNIPSGLRIDNDVSSIVGTPIPSGPIDIIGALGQYKVTPPYNSGYQILPRFLADLVYDSEPFILEPVYTSQIDTSSFNVYFNTSRNGNSQVKYGLTPTLELDSVVLSTYTTNHMVSVTGLNPATLYYFRAYSSNEFGTSFSDLKTVTTASGITDEHEFKIMTYNILNYPNNDTTIRNPYFRTIINETEPDILVVQEIISQGSVNGFLNNVLNISASGYASGLFINGPDTDNAIFYKTNVFEFISTTPIGTSLRDISEFKVVHRLTMDTLRIYSVHLKAGSGTSEENQRLSEVQVLRNVTDVLHSDANFIVLGDFNMYHSNEPAYQKLVDNNLPGYFIDPDPLTGDWNNPSYSSYHTQSTRTRNFGGGSTGGLDDRFDLILFSKSVWDSSGIAYIRNSTVRFGNDGFHYNDSINNPPNVAVSQEVANALHNASDHLPVIATFRSDDLVFAEDDNFHLYSFKLDQNFPNPFNPVTTIRFEVPYSQQVELSVFDMLGREVKVLYNGIAPAGIVAIDFRAEGLASGVYIYRLKTDKFIESKKLLLLK